MNPPQEYIKVFDLSRPTCAFYIVTEVSFCFDDVYFYRNYTTVAKCLFSVFSANNSRKEHEKGIILSDQAPGIFF